MGCGIPTVRMFSIYILEVVPSEQAKKCTIRSLTKDVFTMVDGKKMDTYLEESKNEEVKKYFIDELQRSESIYHFVFDDKTICVAEYEDAKKFIPKDRYSYYKKGTNAIILSNVFIIPTNKLQMFYLTKKTFYAQIEKLVDPRDFQLDVGEGYVVPNEPSELSLDSSEASSESAEVEDINQEREKKVFNKTEVSSEKSEELSDYDSDSSNSLEDLEPEDAEEVICKAKIDQGVVGKVENILNKEKNKEKSLTSVSVIFNKFKDKDKIVFDKLLSIVESKNIKLKKENTYIQPNFHHRPNYLTIFNFHDNVFENAIEETIWDSICSFLESKKTPKAELVDEKEVDQRKNKVLRVLDLSMNHIKTNVFNRIIRSIRNVRLHELNLSGNDISSIGFLISWIGKNKSLQKLFLQNNKQIKADEANQLITDLKKHKKLIDLNMSYIQLKDVGKLVVSLYSNIKKDSPLCRLKILKLRECNLAYSDILEIYEGVSSKSCSLEEIDLSGNNKKGNPEIVKLLIGFISNSPSLISLSIENNKIDQYQTIAETISTKGFIKSNLNHISISDPDLNYFNLFTAFVGDIGSIKNKLTREVEIVAISESQMEDADKNLEKEFKEKKSTLKILVEE